jgi:predicted lipoprotein with Yx(FWY)xxD motif
LAFAVIASIAVAGCSGAAATASPRATSRATSAPSAAPSASMGASASPATSPGTSASASPEGLFIPVPDPSPELTVVTVAGVGKALADENGMLLYADKQDPPDSSGCIGECATTWPPFVVAAGTTIQAGPGVKGTIDTVVRPDGTLQVRYAGDPVYFYQLDPKPGVAKGPGVDPNWILMKP